MVRRRRYRLALATLTSFAVTYLVGGQSADDLTAIQHIVLFGAAMIVSLRVLKRVRDYVDPKLVHADRHDRFINHTNRYGGNT